MTYPVHELFHTFQGEGVHMGRPAFFVRLFGCPVHCPWCDSAGTWHPDWIPAAVRRMDPEEIVLPALHHSPELVVITGGEPAIHDLSPLVDALNAANPAVKVHLETSGAFPIRGAVDWVTVSPKKWKLPLPSSIIAADEFKVIVETPDDIEFYSHVIGPSDKVVWLHPEWSQRNNPQVLSAISFTVKHGKGAYRAGWQLHKLYQVDAEDPRSRPLVPLGGNTEKGY